MKRIIFTLLSCLKENLIFLAALMVYVSVMNLIDIPACLSKLIFGIPCPGCGISRACISLVCFNFVEAFNYNPLVFLLPIFIVVIIYKDYKIVKRIYNSKVFWLVSLVLVIVTFTLRMVFLYPNPPLDLNEKSILFLIINGIKSLWG